MRTPHLIHQDAGPRDLALLRIWVFGLWAIKVALDPMHRLAALPGSIYRPMGLLHWLPDEVSQSMLSPGGLWALKLSLLATICATALGAATRVAAPAAFALLVAYKTLLQGFGDVPHVELVHLFAAGILALFPCADAIAVRPDTPRRGRDELYSVPLIAVIGTLSLSYMFVGAYRLLHGLGAMATARSLEFWTLELTLGSTEYGWNYGLVLLDHPWLSWPMAFGFAVTNAFETLAPVCLISRRFRAAFVTWMVPFHLGAWLLMKILFWENLALYVFLLEKGPGRAASSSKRPPLRPQSPGVEPPASEGFGSNPRVPAGRDGFDP